VNLLRARSGVRRPIKGHGEQDVHTRWRRLYCYTQRAGVTAKIKRQTRRRERREGKREMRRSDG
jgi:hypothetical protein